MHFGPSAKLVRRISAATPVASKTPGYGAKALNRSVVRAGVPKTREHRLNFAVTSIQVATHTTRLRQLGGGPRHFLLNSIFPED